MYKPTKEQSLERAAVYQEYAAYAHTRVWRARNSGYAARRIVHVWQDQARLASMMAMHSLFEALEE